MVVQDEWLDLIPGKRLRSLTADSRQTFDRRVTAAVYPPAVIFETASAEALLTVPVPRRGVTRYWVPRDGAVAVTIACILNGGIRDESVARDLSEAALAEQLKGAVGIRLALWTHLHPIGRWRPVGARLIVLMDGADNVLAARGGDRTLPGMSEAELGGVPDITIEIDEVVRLVASGSERRNVSAIRRDPRLLRENYQGWRSYAEKRPDR